jgi:DNA repair exonuclease SbcCD ATPase subunit
MKIKRLLLKNFMIIEDFEEDFSENYMTIFSGQNGQGKSSVLFALALCLIEQRKGDSYRDYVKNGQETAYVEMEMIHDNKPILFKITVNSNKSKTSLEREILYDGKVYINSECTTLTNELFNYNVYSLVVFSMQHDASIVTLRPAERRDLFKKIFDFDLEEPIDKIAKVIEDEYNSILSCNSKIDLLKDKKYDLKPLEELSTKEEMTAYEEEKSNIEKKINDLSEEKTNIEKSLSAYLSDKNTLDHLNDYFSSSKKDIENYEDQLKKKMTEKETYSDFINKEYDEKKTKNQDLIKAIEASIEKHDLQVSDIDKSLEKNKDALNKSNVSITLLKSRIKSHENGICSECGHETDKSQVESFKKSLACSESEVRVLMNEKKNLQDLKTNLELIKKDVIKKKNEAEKESTRLLTYKSNTESNLERVENEIKGLTSSIDGLKTKLKTYEDKIKEVEDKIAAFDLVDTSKKNYRLEEIKSETAEANLALKNIVSKIQDESFKEKANELIKKINTEILEQEKNDKQLIIDLYSKIDKASKNIEKQKEIKYLIEVELTNFAIISVCSELEKMINELIQSVKESIKVKLFQTKTGVEFFYSTDNKKSWLSVKMASGFEEQLLSIAFKVTIAKLYNIDILILDEIDSSATSENSERLFKTLSELEGFSQIFLITQKHTVVEILKDNIDNVTNYVAENGQFILN